MRKTKRGRLSSIDLLPDEAEPLVVVAFAELRERKKPQTAILEELNTGLADLGIGSISWPAFNRKAMWVMTYGRHLEEAREIAAIMGEKLSKVPDGDIGRLLNETLKTLIFELISEESLSEDGPSMALLANASKALGELERARRFNVETANKMRIDFADEAVEAVVRVAEKKGLTATTVEEIKSQILGIREGASDA